MTIKRLRSMSVLLAMVLLLGILPPLPVFAVVTDPPGFAGNEISAVNLEVDTGYAWHAMTADEATTYGLSGENVYIAGNSGKDVEGKAPASVSNLAIKVTKAGTLTFDYAVSTKVGGLVGDNFFLGYGIDEPVPENATTSTANYFAQGQVVPVNGIWSSYSISVDENMLGDDGELTIYIAYRHGNYDGTETDGSLNFAAIRNVSYTTGNRSNVIQDYDPAMGTVTAERVTVEEVVGADGIKTEKEVYTPVDITDLAVGNTYRITAKANEGYQLYGWFRHYLYNGNWLSPYQVSDLGTITITVNETTWYNPIFAKEGTYIARVGSVFYEDKEGTDGLTQALAEASRNSVVVLLKDYTMTSDLTVPAGVTLYVPYQDTWSSREAEGKYALYSKDDRVCSMDMAGEDKAHVTLTIPEGKELIVNGTLAVGAVLGYPSQRYQGHVSGVHGRINNSGTIHINNGGKFDCMGIVEGSGEVYVCDGATLRESLIIGDFAGGSNSLDLFVSNQMPFKRFSMQSVRCTLKMERQASLVAAASVWALYSYNTIDINLYKNDEMSLFKPDSTKEDTLGLIRTYDAAKALTDGNGLLDVTGVGRTEWNFYGGMTFQPFIIVFAGFKLSTVNADLTVPYNFDIHLHEGNYYIPAGVRVMPGAEVTVESTATGIIGGRLLVLDGLVQTDMSGDRYPNKDELIAAGFKPYGVLNVNGKLIMESGSTLGGVVNSTGGGTLIIKEGVHLINGTYDADGNSKLNQLDPTKELAGHIIDDYASRREDKRYTGLNNWVQQDGTKGTYDENTAWFNLPAQLYNGTTMIRPEAGKTYVSTALDSAATVSDNYEGLYVLDGEYDNKVEYADGKRDMEYTTYDFDRTVNASWADGSAKIEVNVNATVPGGTNTASPAYGVKILVSSTEGEDGNTLVEIVTTECEAIFVHLVKYKLADGTEVILTNGEGTHRDGTFIIPADAVSATVESGLLGDTNGDGLIAPADITLIARALAGLDELSDLHTLAANANGDNVMSPADATKLARFLANLDSLN